MKFGKMKPHRRNRLLLALFLVVGAGGATTFALLALNENINLFYSPEQIVTGEAPVGKNIRAGGMVMAATHDPLAPGSGPRELPLEATS